MINCLKLESELGLTVKMDYNLKGDLLEMCWIYALVLFCLNIAFKFICLLPWEFKLFHICRALQVSKELIQEKRSLHMC